MDISSEQITLSMGRVDLPMRDGHEDPMLSCWQHPNFSGSKIHSPNEEIPQTGSSNVAQLRSQGAQISPPK